jgi:O-antigen/teichoic acid export membrane protein
MSRWETASRASESRREARSFAWGFVAQGFSSAANFGLSVTAGRLLGPRGLGVVFIGFAAYQLVLGLQRAVLVQPLIAHAAPLGTRARVRLSHSGLMIALASGLLASLVLGLAALALKGDSGRGFLLFAPWIAGGLLHEFWKAVLFQEGLGAAAALTEATRLGVMLLGLPVAVAHPSDYVVVAIWGIASLAGFAVGALKFAVRLAAPLEAFAWLRAEAWKLGRWLGARELVYQAGTYTTVLVLAAVIGSTNLGGLRSAEALFSPFSLIAAAFVLPALPALARARASSRDAARSLAVRIGLAGAGLGLLYFVVMAFAGGWLLVHLFGASFDPFRKLIWPIAVGQLFYAGSFGFTPLLVAEKRGRELLVIGATLAVTTIAFATLFASIGGVTGAAWGMTTASAISAVVLVALGRREEVAWLRPRASTRDRE